MSSTFTEDKDFKGVIFSREIIPEGDYENCLFDKCIFSNLDLSNINFIECEFVNCDFSLAKLTNTSFREVKFIECKLVGMHFENCNKIGLSAGFEDCQMDLSSFYKLNLRNVTFKGCILHEVDFTESDLTGLVLEKCNLSGAIFENTILEKTDFRTSQNYSIDPETNRIRKAKFSITDIVGLLDQYDIEIS